VTLSNLIRKRDTGNLATAIPAISATQPKGEAGTVARIATVAVANPKEGQTALPAKVSPGDTATASRWFLHFADREPIMVSFSPAVTHDEAMACYPDAVAGEPGDLHTVRKSAPLAAEEEAAIRAWLAAIGEDDQATIAAVIEECRTDTEARRYFTGRAAADLPKPDPLPDDRRTCDQCANLIARRCQAAKRGEIVASRNYEPIRDLPRRCEGYAPGAADTDRRPGVERWPGLTDTKGGDHANH
jgi:hypothetical protein